MSGISSEWDNKEECSGIGKAAQLWTQQDQTEFLEEILDRKADVNTRGTDGKTILYTAALKNSIGCLKLLLDRGANPNLVEKPNGASPLIIAASRGHLKCCQLLIQFKADVNIVSTSGTALSLSCGVRSKPDQDFDAVTDLLICEGADINIPCDNGMLPIDKAIRFKHVRDVRILLEKSETMVEFCTEAILQTSTVPFPRNLAKCIGEFAWGSPRMTDEMMLNIGNTFVGTIAEAQEIHSILSEKLCKSGEAPSFQDCISSNKRLMDQHMSEADALMDMIRGTWDF